jgi:SAM-dependent methyltransferase
MNKKYLFFLKNLISKKYSTGGVLDLGCARGEFLYYMSQKFKYTKLFGIDYSDNLIAQAKVFYGLKDIANFQVGSAEEFELDEKFEIITMIGVLSYFDDPRNSIRQIKNHLAKDGTAFIFGFFNDYDVDVHIRYRNNKYFNTFESGWNYHSLETIQKVLLELNLVLVDVHNFNTSFDIGKNADPARSWHIDTSEGKKFTNGLGLLFDLRALEIKHNMADKNED